MRVAVFGIKAMPAFAGADRVAERLLEHMPDHDYTIYVLRGAGRRPENTGRCRYVEVPALRGKHLRAFSYFFFSALHFVLHGDADVAHVHNSEFGLFCPMLKLRRRTRIVGTFHGMHNGPVERAKWGWFARGFLRLSEWVFVRSCDELTTVAPLPVAPARSVHYIPNGVDKWVPPAKPAQLPKDFPPLAPRSYILFACGRLDRTKGLHHLLRAYRDVPGEHSLLAVGDFSHDAHYSEEIEEQAERDSRVVLYRSLLNRDSLFRVLAESAAFVFPSEFEAMSMMLLEALSCGALVICSDIAENTAVVGNDYPFLFRSGDPVALAGALERAVRDLSDSDDVRSLAERRSSEFRWPEIAGRYEALYTG